MHTDAPRRALRLPLRPAVLVVADELLLLAVDGDHRLVRRQALRSAVVDVAELGVAVGMLGTVGDLGVGLQAVAEVVEQLPDKVRPHLVAEAGQLRRQRARRLGGPAQRRHRGRRVIPARRERRAPRAGRVEVCLALGTCARTAHPCLQLGALGQRAGTGEQRIAAHPGGLCHPRLPAPPEHLHHRCRQQPPLALVEERTGQREEPGQALSSPSSTPPGYYARLIGARTLIFLDRAANAHPVGTRAAQVGRHTGT